MQQLKAEAGKMNLRPQLPMSQSLYILSKTPVAKTDIFESPYRVHLLCVIRVQKYHFSEQSPNSWFHHPSESSMATLQVHGVSRTLLSFPIPEDHRVDLPRNKCPAGDNTHGAPRVAPKNCPPKKQANHPQINCHYPQKVSLLSVKLKALLRHLILNHSWGELFGNLSHAHFPYRTPQKSRLKKSQKTVVSCRGDSIRRH